MATKFSKRKYTSKSSPRGYCHK